MDPRILAVDTEVEALGELTTQLQRGGWLPVPAFSVDLAMNLLHEDKWDLVLLGCNLGGASPEDVVKQLKQPPSGLICPVLVLLDESGYRSRGAAVLDAGADLIVPTPVADSVLFAFVQNLLGTKARADDLRQRSRELEGLRREHRMLMDALIHDLKNPLAVVLANVGWALDYLNPNDTEPFEALQDAQEGVRRIESTLDDLALLSKLENAEVPLRRESIRVSELVRSVVTSRAPEAKARKVSLTTDIDDELEYSGDPTVLRRVLDGMLESSIRYAPSAGNVELCARVRSGLEIEVTNSGGLLPASERRIPVAPRSSEQAQDAGDEDDATEGSSSLALRLYFCRKAVEAFHGRLDLVETPEARRSLVIRLPDVGT